MQECHEKVDEHIGFSKTLAHICDTCYIKGMMKTVREYVWTCPSCHPNISSNHAPMEILEPITPGEPG